MPRAPLFAFVALLSVPLAAQISPGPLSKAHATLSGPSRCGLCHAFGSGTPQLRCLNCHNEIRDRIAKHEGYHAAVVHSSADKEDCARCHQEHAGANFNIVRWGKPRAQFDHRQTGYALEGKHASVACEKCHTEAHVSQTDRAIIKVKDLNHTYLGLTAQCVSCHADEHRAQLGTDCAKCHSVEGWKPASGFKHSSARFQLAGLHATKVACQQCHKPINGPDAKTYIQYRNIAFAACVDCHRDPHRSAFQSSCQSCHNVNGWKQVNTSAGFDHSRTKYPLLKLHAQVDCFKCHKTDNFSEAVTHDRCDACHKPDPHKGQFENRDCASCHDEGGFKNTSFTVARHKDSRYPLQGKHQTVECAKCHIPAGAGTVYRVKFDACTDCHKDAHGGQFATAKFANRCNDCHTVEGFRPSTYSKADHQQTRFPLNSGHAATACADCHKPANLNAATTTKYHFESLACLECHEDPHQGQFKESALEKCESCHSLRSWKEMGAFDHDTTKFKLEGAHRPTACLECHKPANFAKGIQRVVFREAPTTCEGCHENIHGDQFTTSGKAVDCTSCHNLVAWKPSAFDHERQSKFSLKGAHERVPCAGCHKRVTFTGGREAITYKGTSNACSDCH